MKFLQILTFASLALALPESFVKGDALAVREIEKRATVTETIQSSVSTLQQAVDANIAALNTAVDRIKGSVDAEVIVQVRGIVKANLQAIADALGVAATSIVGVTTGAAGGVVGALVGLTQSQVDSLLESLRQIFSLLLKIRAVVTVTATNLIPDIKLFIGDELKAVKNAVGPFVAPLNVFVQAITEASVALGVTVTGVVEVVGGINGVVLSIARGV